MAASAKKKNKKGKTLTLTDFLADDGGSGGGGGGSSVGVGGGGGSTGGGFRDSYQSSGRDSYQSSGRDSYRDSGRDSYQSSGRDSYRDSGRDSYQSSGRDSYQSSGRDSYRDSGRDSYRDSGRDSGRDGGGGSTYTPKPVSWADETDDLEGDVSTTWQSNEEDGYGSRIDRSILPTAPRAAREPDVDRSRLPKSPPFTAFLGNLPYDVSEESIQKFFRGLNISAVRLPREPSNPERLKGFGYAEFDDLDSLLSALSLNEESLGNRRIRVDIADQAQDKDRDDRSFGRDRDRNRDSDKTDSSDWRARPTTDAADDNPPRREEGFGDRYRSDRGDRYESDRYRDGPRRDDRFDRDRGRDRYDDRDRGSDSWGGSAGGSGRRAFGTGYRRDDDFRGGGSGGGGGGGSDRYGGDRYDDRREDRSDKWNGFSRNEEKREERGGGVGGGGGGPIQRPRLNLKPRTAPKEEESTATSRAASIFGGAKPVDTAAREREVEERLQKEQEKMHRHLEDDRPRQIERKPRERHPSWRSEENQERSRTGSESSQTGTGGSSRISRRRESEKSVENEVFGKDEEPPSLKSPKSDSQLPFKVMPAPPPKENAWAKRTTAPGPSRSISSESSQSGGERPYDSERRQPVNVQGDENTDDLDHVSKSSGRGIGDRNQVSDRDDEDLNVVSEPMSKDEQAAKFSHASKYAALSVDGEEEPEEYAD
ncbi:eukaryotic translation initiation factor 4B isoform X2 [Rana temporaria]|uniref:eukaryotic translation initiation factor 4B isoform X2 n=1 Tax=Rana temporaria TaxID=8407 RepID=UPI001AADB987|nr:eukaryotic translation initiation factor 4B isoform X2 [Rana temporaria]